MDREINIVLMKEGFLCDGKDEQEDGNNISKKRDRDSSVSDIDGTSDQPKKEKLKKIWFFYFDFEYVYLRSYFETF